MKKQYYVEFKTWLEGYVTIPWSWAKFEELPDYRLKRDVMVSASPSKIKSVFLNMDSDACTKFLSEYTAALVVGVIIDLVDANQASTEIKSVFGSCEILGICEVTDNNRDKINQVIANAQLRLGVGSPS